MGQYFERDRTRNRYSDRDTQDRGILDRATDEVKSWFGNDNAERRHHQDSRQDRYDDRDYSWNEDRYRRRGYYESDRTSGQRGHFAEIYARDVMNHDVVTVRAGDSIMLAARLMGECDCGALPVVNRDGVLIGMITDRDIAVRAVAKGYDTRRTRVDECMTDETFACHANESVDECMREMARHQIRRLPIVDSNDRVIGIVSQGDLARHAGDHVGQGERRAVADTLYKISEPTERAYR